MHLIHTQIEMKEKLLVDSHCSVTESMHHSSISPCQGADPEGKKEGAGEAEA